MSGPTSNRVRSEPRVGSFDPGWSPRLWVLLPDHRVDTQKITAPPTTPLPYPGVWLLGNLCFLEIPDTTLVTQNQNLTTGGREACV